MCNFYSITKGQQAIRQLARAMLDRTGNLPPLPGIFPVYPGQEPTRRPRADDGAMGNVVAFVRIEGPQF